MKGPKRQYAYWQYYENGKHIFRFVKGKALEEARRQLSEKEALRQASLAAAQTRKYADSHKHFTDRGEVVAFKSEMIIANELARQNLRYAEQL